jgi:hypothetical protein
MKNLVRQNFPKSQYNWIIQQLLKIKTTLNYAVEHNILIMDSDTVLTQPILFVNGNRQILSITREYHRQYVMQYQTFSNSNFDLGFSFVTHHQLWQRDIVEDLWGNDRLEQWLKAADLSSSSSISEYHSYGSHLVRKFPNRFAYSNWGNIELSRSSRDYLSYENICEMFPKSRSVSIHSYS